MTIEHLPADDAAHEFAPPSPVLPTEHSEPTLGVLVTSLVRGTPDAVLAACAIAGLIGSGVLALTVARWSRAIAPLVLLSTFGIWGMLDRARDATGVRGMFVRVARVLTMLVSFAAVGAMILAFLGVALGTWIS